MCPQGFSCCTLEMEEKLSQQSHTEIKAPVSRLSTNLQSTFKQRHDHFDSKQTHLHKQTRAHQLLFFWGGGYIVPLASVSYSGNLCCMIFLTDAPTCQCTAWSGDSQSVSVGPSTCLSTSQLPASSSPLNSARFPSRKRERETCMLPDGPHTSSDFVFAVFPVPLCASTCVCVCVCL